MKIKFHYDDTKHTTVVKFMLKLFLFCLLCRTCIYLDHKIFSVHLDKGEEGNCDSEPIWLALEGCMCYINFIHKIIEFHHVVLSV